MVFAATGGDVGVIKLLIERGARVTTSAYMGHLSPLMVACCNGRLAAVQLLVASGADPEAVRKCIAQLPKDGLDAPSEAGMTALHYACVSGVEEVVIELLQAGADPTRRDVRGLSPGELAAASHHLDVVRELLAWDRAQ